MVKRHYSIRAMEATHLESCAQVICRAFGTVAEAYGFTTENNPTHGAFVTADRLMRDMVGGASMFGLYNKDELTGFVQVTRRDGHCWELEKLCVTPEHRHRGGGKMLLDFARKYVARLGGRRITIGIIDDNARLREWYRDCGFEVTGLREFEHLPFTVCFMALEV